MEKQCQRHEEWKCSSEQNTKQESTRTKAVCAARTKVFQPQFWRCALHNFDSSKAAKRVHCNTMNGQGMGGAREAIFWLCSMCCISPQAAEANCGTAA